jgi:hypothetical protein
VPQPLHYSVPLTQHSVDDDDDDDDNNVYFAHFMVYLITKEPIITDRVQVMNWERLERGL